MASDSVRRIMAEVKELSKLNNTPNTFFHAAPLESDLFEWHFTVRGPPDTSFEEGVYHGRIVLPPEYPLKPPEIILLTPNGRFETGKRICLSVTAHHQETWQPSWGIRTIITALVGFMPSRAEGVGALDYPDQDRRSLARRSHTFRCDRCGICPAEQLPPRKLGQKLGHKAPEKESASVKVEHRHENRGQPVAETRPSSSQTEPPATAITPAASTAPVTSTTPPTDPQPQQSNGNTPRTTRHQSGTQERELLYLAYAIAGVMVGVIIRRLLKLLP